MKFEKQFLLLIYFTIHRGYSDLGPSDVIRDQRSNDSNLSHFKIFCKSMSEYRKVFNVLEINKRFCQSRPWVQDQIRFQNPVKFFFLRCEFRDNFIHLSYYGSKKRCCTQEEEDAKHLRIIISHIFVLIKGYCQFKIAYSLPSSRSINITCKRISCRSNTVTVV